MLRSLLGTAIRLLMLSILLTGLAYPLAVTGLAQLIFPHQANGSLIERDGAVVGSELLGQPFDSPEYFWGRPSATAPFAYNAAASGGSNWGPSNPALHEAVQQRVAALQAANAAAGVSVSGPAPVDLVTASASGLDPHISLAAANYQLSRVAATRGLTEQQVKALVEQATEGRTWGILGEPRVNVLKLNLALNALQ